MLNTFCLPCIEVNVSIQIALCVLWRHTSHLVRRNDSLSSHIEYSIFREKIRDTYRDLCQSCLFSDLLFRIATESTILGPHSTKKHAVLGSCDLSCHHSRPRTRSARAKVDFWLHRINVENYMKRCERDPVEPERQLFFAS